MQSRLKWGALMVALAVALVGCTINMYEGGDVNSITGSSSPGTSASPSPGAGNSGVARVRIGEFGEVCPAGLTPAETAPRQVRLGCSSAITCTPLDAQGRELPHENPPPLNRFGVVAGDTFVIVDPHLNPFNLDVYGRAPGVATFQCCVGGVCSDPWAFTVVP